MEDDKKIEGMLTKVLNEETSLKKISVSVASAVLATSLIGSIVLYKEFIHIQDWAKHHEDTAKMHISRIGALEDQANQGGRWTLGNHNEYARQIEMRDENLGNRISMLERSTDLTEYKLETMDGKLDEIVELLNAAVLNRKESRDADSLMQGM